MGGAPVADVAVGHGVRMGSEFGWFGGWVRRTQFVFDTLLQVAASSRQVGSAITLVRVGTDISS